MDASEIHEHIDALVAEERSLRATGHRQSEEERERLGRLEVQLDRCWDLLRQRDALREAGRSPDEATERPAAQVESYLQ